MIWSRCLARAAAPCSALLFLGCTVEPPPAVVLVVLDTVRADHLSLYGYDRPTTPRLEQLAGEGAVFEHAFSPAAWTLPGVASILTGHWPSHHGAGFGSYSGFSQLRDDVATLPEVLAEQGFRTAAIANGGYLHEEFGLARGFEHYDFEPATDESIRRADVSVDLALDWLEQTADDPAFLMLHVFDAHRYYDAPEPARGAFTAEFAEDYGDTMASLESRVQAEERGDLEFWVAAYDEELLWLDMQLERMLAGVRATRPEALIVIVADHGEAFREHDVLAHGNSVHNTVVRTPLLMFGPGVVPGRYRTAVSNVDVFNTVLEHAGLEADPQSAGSSLWPLFTGGELPERVLYAQNDFYDTDLVAVIRWPMKLIHDFARDREYLYDLSTDLTERTDLYDDQDGPTMRFVRSLRRLARELRSGQEGNEAELSPELTRQLRALGYIQ